MMPCRRKRIAAAVLIMMMLASLLTGCWDQREINDFNILTGTALDLDEESDKLHILLQVAKIKRGESGSGEGSSGGGGDVILIETVSDTLMSGITEMNRNSSNNLMFQHNQIRLFGIALAEQGVEKYLDMLLRDLQARLEVPMAVVDGNAGEALSVKVSQEPISGIFLNGMFRDLHKTSVKYRVRLIDFVHRLLDDSAAPVMPIIKVTGEGEKEEYKLDGMAVFKKDKMVGRLTNDETLGYIWSFGDVKKCNINVMDDTGNSELHIQKLDCKRNITLNPDGSIKAFLSINAVLTVREVGGFEKMNSHGLVKHLERLAQDKIKKNITDSFTVAQNLNADIFEFCTMMYRKYPKQWEKMKDYWDDIFPNIDLSMEVKVRIPGTGQIVQSLEMEENMR